MSGRGQASLTALSVVELRRGYDARMFSPREVVDALATQAERIEPRINALNACCFERAFTEARLSEQRIVRNEARPLEGVPFVAKDLLDSAGVPTTRGSAMFRELVPDKDAAAVHCLRQAGAILIGKSATHEFGWGVTTSNEHYGATRNPWNLECVPGGSSGGSAAALAAHETPLALGTDTGGSIRVPAAFCGVAGLKPTHGCLDMSGIFPLAPSLDSVGPMARTPQDLALTFAVLTGSRSASKDNGPETLQWNKRSVRELRLGIYRGPWPIAPAPAVIDALESAARVFDDLGTQIVDVKLPALLDAYDVFAPILLAEARHGHTCRDLFPLRAAQYGKDVAARLEIAAAVDSRAFLSAGEARSKVRSAFARAFADVDVLLSPVTPVSSLPLGADRIDHFDQQLDIRALVMSYTVPQSLAGLPVCSVRSGFDSAGMPIGVQFTASAGREADVLSAAHVLVEFTGDIQARWPAHLL